MSTAREISGVDEDVSGWDGVFQLRGERMGVADTDHTNLARKVSTFKGRLTLF